MLNDDTIKLLGECDSGIKMAVDSINEVLRRTETDTLRQILDKYLETHEKIGVQIQQKLEKLNDSGKNPNPVAVAMSWMKTEYKLLSGNSDKEIADLMTEGCNMGIKSIAKYLNQYAAATEEVKEIARQIITTEEQFEKEIRCYL